MHFKIKVPIIAVLIVLMLGLLCGTAVAVGPGELYVEANYNGEGSDGTSESPFKTIREAVEAAEDGDIVKVRAGEYDVTCFDGDKFIDYLRIEKPITIQAADMQNRPVLKATYGGDMAFHRQATVHIYKTDHVTLDGLIIYAITDYPSSFIKALEITGANHATINNCVIYGGGDTAIYLSGAGVGKYTIKNNILHGAIVPANGAGNGPGGEEAIISGNTINASISFTGKTNSGWDPNSFENYPIIQGNVINGTAQGMLINSRDEDPGKLITDEMMDRILKNNRFPEGVVQAVQDSYEYYGAELHRKRLILNTEFAKIGETGEIKLTFAQSGVTLVIDSPADDAYVSVTRYNADDRSAPAGAVPAGIYLRLERSDNLAGATVRIEVAYDPDELPAGMCEDALRLYRYSEERGQWEIVARQGVDKEGQFLWAELDTFSLFGIFAGSPGEESATGDSERGDTGMPSDRPDLPQTSAGLPCCFISGLLALAGSFLLVRKKGLPGR